MVGNAGGPFAQSLQSGFAACSIACDDEYARSHCGQLLCSYRSNARRSTGNNNNLASHTIVHTNFEGLERKYSVDFQRFHGAAALQS